MSRNFEPSELSEEIVKAAKDWASKEMTHLLIEAWEKLSVSLRYDQPNADDVTLCASIYPYLDGISNIVFDENLAYPNFSLRKILFEEIEDEVNFDNEKVNAICNALEKIATELRRKIAIR